MFVAEYINRFNDVKNRFKYASYRQRIIFSIILTIQMLFISPATFLIYYLMGDQLAWRFHKLSALWLGIYGYLSRTIGTFLLFTILFSVEPAATTLATLQIQDTETEGTGLVSQEATNDPFIFIAIFILLIPATLSGAAYLTSTELTLAEVNALGMKVIDELPMNGIACMAAWGLTNLETAASWLALIGVGLVVRLGRKLKTSHCHSANCMAFLRRRGWAARMTHTELTSTR